MAVDVGILCLNTERVIKFAEEELRTALREAPSEVVIGSGLDRVVVRARRPEDERPPITYFGPFGTVRRVGRPDMCTCVGCTDATGLAVLGGYGIPGGINPSMNGSLTLWDVSGKTLRIKKWGV